MTEHPISPLARRIAEENNVDWRTLAGSSAGGSVNERDVLNYLEGVMLGTQPVNPTPEPLPEGMTAWPEETIYVQASAAVAETDTFTETAVLSAISEAISETAELAEAAEAKGRFQALEAAYRDALAELEALKLAAQGSEADRRTHADASAAAQAETAQVRGTLEQQNTELTTLKTRLAEADILEQERQNELARLRQTVETQNEELVKVDALKRRTEGLQELLAAAQAETKTLQAQNRNLTEQSNQAEAATKQAQSETERLRSAHAGLEKTVAELKKRPWWKLWG